MSKNIKLKSCPFCGEEVEITKSYMGYSSPIWELAHQCSKRQHIIFKGETKKEVIKYWNIRND